MFSENGARGAARALQTHYGATVKSDARYLGGRVNAFAASHVEVALRDLATTSGFGCMYGIIVIELIIEVW